MIKLKREQKNVPPIDYFTGYYQFLSMEFPASVYYQGFMYSSVFIAFQAARGNDSSLRKKLSESKDPQEIKRLIIQVKNAPDWSDKRINIMKTLNRDKFKRNKQLGMKLLATQSRALINGYERGSDAQKFWGVVRRQGKVQGINTLGLILTVIRQQIREGKDSLNWISDRNIQSNSNLWPDANLIVEKQGDQNDSFQLSKKNMFFFGQHESNDLKLQHKSISKHHACIYFSTDPQIVIVDLNSTNGTFIVRRGQKIKLEPLRPQYLQNKDIIIFGQSTRQYHLFLSYENVQKYIKIQQEEQKKKLQQISKIKQLDSKCNQNNSNGRDTTLLKQALQPTKPTCLFVQNVLRNYTYFDIKKIFQQFGPVKNLSMITDQRTKRFTQCVFIRYHDTIQISEIMNNIKNNSNKLTFKITPITQLKQRQITLKLTGKQKKQNENKNNYQQRQSINNKKWDKRSSRPRRRRSSDDSSSDSSSSRSQRSRSYRSSSSSSDQ